jgi:acyl carrier protein
MPQAMFSKVAELISKNTKIPIERITANATFEELGLDSLDATTLLFELEGAFDVSIPDDEALKLKDVRQVVECLQKLGVSIE